MHIATLAELRAVVEPLMRGFDRRWCVAGGWAIDLCLGRVTRSHADLELAILRRDQQRLHEHFDRWRFDKIVDGERVPWQRGEELHLPVHEIHGRSEADPSLTIEILLNESDAGQWRFRRNLDVSLPLERAMLSGADGVPMLAPEIVLLYKSKSPRSKDDADFHATLPALDRASRDWLATALSVVDPLHPWLPKIGVDRCSR